MTDTQIERLSEFRGNDLADLCDAAEAAIVAGGGFGWLAPPRRDVMEAYWRGNLLVPGRTVFVGRLDGVIAGSAQLNRPRASSSPSGRRCSAPLMFSIPALAATQSGTPPPSVDQRFSVSQLPG